MERKLILGGWEHLPYARSMIKQLRGAGLRYAASRKIIAGSTIAVRVVGDDDYIHISGGQCLLPMDSGVVDVGIYISDEDPFRYAAGTLWESHLAQAYNQPFVLDGAWRRNPAPGSAGQFSGILTRQTYFKGRVPVDGEPARSFSPRLLETGPTFEPDPADQNLLDKKRASMYCPASMFTGKARLYAQAMYGQHLYAEEKRLSDGTVISAPMEPLPPQPGLRDSIPPSLSMPIYQSRADDPPTEPYPEIVLDTNSGVHLDADGKHWLFCVDSNTVKVFPLIGSPCAEAQRKHLKPASTLSIEDREHLEAYVLASCRPYAARRMVLDLNVAVPAYSMGYGWHWNWSGTCADIVINGSFEQGGEAIAMRSTHYRLTVGRVSDAWACEVSVIEGPVDWTVLRPIWVITEPSWINLDLDGIGPPVYSLIKTTFEDTSQFECNGIFYAFYAKDELKTCRVEVTHHDATPLAYRSSPAFRDGTDEFTGGNVTYVTFGMLDGFTESDTGTSEYWTCTFTCGGVVLADLTYNRGASGSRSEIVNKVMVSEDDNVTWADNYEEDLVIEYGDDPDVPYSTFTYDGFESQFAHTWVDYDFSYHNYTDAWYSKAAIVVPFYDAEAVYLQGRNWVDRTNTGRMTERQNSGRYVLKYQPKFGDLSLGNVYYKHFYQDISFNAVVIPLEPKPDEVVTTVEVDIEKIVHRAGASEAFYGFDLDAFFDNENDRVGATFKTLSSTNFVDPVVIGKLADTSIGTDIDTGNLALVGWA